MYSFRCFIFSLSANVLCTLRSNYGKNWINITPKEFKDLSKLAENTYNINVVIDYFCKNQPEIEELYNLAPIVENLRNNTDKLNAFFIDSEKS